MKDRQILTFPRIFRKEADGHVFYTDNSSCLLSYEGDGGEVTVPEGVKSIGAGPCLSVCPKMCALRKTLLRIGGMKPGRMPAENGRSV